MMRNAETRDRPTSLTALTPRQSQILELLSRGHHDKEIATSLGISYRTVRTHLERLYHASGAPNRAALVARWVASER